MSTMYRCANHNMYNPGGWRNFCLENVAQRGSLCGKCDLYHKNPVEYIESHLRNLRAPFYQCNVSGTGHEEIPLWPDVPGL